MKDAILNQNMNELFNSKLTPNKFDGAEDYNNKFNDVVNTLQQQGHVISPQILKSIFLSNIQDKTHENIKDHAGNEEDTILHDIQASILKQYLSVVGE